MSAEVDTTEPTLGCMWMRHACRLVLVLVSRLDGERGVRAQPAPQEFAGPGGGTHLTRRGGRSAPPRFRRERPEIYRRRRALVGAVLLLVFVVLAITVTRLGSAETTTPALPPPVPAAPDGATPDGATEPAPSSSSVEPVRPTASVPPAPPPAPSAAPPPAPVPERIPDRGSGDFVRSEVRAAATSTKGRLIRYDVRVEKGLPFDAAQSARQVHAILSDRRSWTGSGEWRFEQVSDPADATVRIVITTPDTTDRMCAPLRTRGEVSCRNGSRVVLNARRWAFGAEAYGADLEGYRTYLVNHEVGHALGWGHVECPGAGRRAPIMMQQTKGLDSCRANPWPAPERR